MTRQEFARSVAMIHCDVKQTKRQIVLTFPNMVIRLDKKFDYGKCYVFLLTAAGWMQTISDILNGKEDEE